MPFEKDLPRAYHAYYTHEDPGQKQNPARQRFTAFQKQMLKSLLRLTPIYREREDFNQMYLGNIKPGRLLGVGCGSGARLAYLAQMGWAVEGQEVDPVSAAVAGNYGIKVHLGPLDSLFLPASSYDAIVMNHVIEHVQDPIKLLMECRRLLSPNGILISITPNTYSLGHRIFKYNWRGLEPPRHVFLYCQNSLHLLTQKAGFENPDSWTTSANAHHFALDSLKIVFRRTNLNMLNKIIINIASGLFLFAARIIHALNKDSGEECVLMLRKYS